MNLGAIRAFDYVTIRHDAIDIHEKTAAARKLFAARVESFDRYR